MPNSFGDENVIGKMANGRFFMVKFETNKLVLRPKKLGLLPYLM